MTEDAIAIVPARREQLPEVQRLAREIWHAHYPGIITSAQIDYMLEQGYALEVLERFVGAPDRGLYLAHLGNEPSAFAAWRMTDAPGEAKLERLYVLQACQRRGLGRRLIAHVTEAARAADATTLILNVNKYNTQAIRAYEKHGFAIRGALILDIGKGYFMDDYVMQRNIGE